MTTEKQEQDWIRRAELETRKVIPDYLIDIFNPKILLKILKNLRGGDNDLR